MRKREPFRLRLSPVGLMIVHLFALTLTGLIVRAVDPMRSLMIALRRGTGSRAEEQSIIILTNNAMLMGLNASFLGGVLAERAITILHPKTLAAVGYVLWAVGWVGLLQESSTLVCCGSICLGLSFPAILNAMLFITAMQRSHTIGLSLLSTSADISTCIPFLLSKIVLWTGISDNPGHVRIFLIVFVVISSIVSATSTLLCASVEADDYGFEKRIRLDSSTRLSAVHRSSKGSVWDVHAAVNDGVGADEDGSSDEVKLDEDDCLLEPQQGGASTNTTYESVSALGGAIAPMSSSKGESSRISSDSGSSDIFESAFASLRQVDDDCTLCEKVRSPAYVLFAVFFCFNILRMTHFLLWNRATLEAANEGTPGGQLSVGVSMDFYNILTIFAFVPGFVWGKVSQSIGILRTNCLLNAFGVIATYTTTLSSVWLQRVGIASFIIHQSFVFSNMFCFLSDVFGFRDLVPLEGILGLVTVVVNSTLIVWSKFVIEYLDADWVMIGKCLTLAGMVIFTMPLALMILIRRKKLQQEARSRRRSSRRKRSSSGRRRVSSRTRTVSRLGEDCGVAAATAASAPR